MLTDPSTPTGSYTLTITGTGGGLSHSTAVTLEVARPDFTLDGSPASQTVFRGASTSYTVSVKALRGFAGYVSLSVSGIPAGATGSFNRNPTYTSSTLTVSTSASTPAGSHTLTITGTSGSLSHSTTVTLVVQAAVAPDFSLSPSSPSQTLAAGATTSYTISITRAGGFSGAVSLSVSGLPAGASGSFFPNPASGGSSTLTVSSSSSTPTGTYTLAITGSRGSLTRSATLTLIVGAPTSPDFSLSPSPASVTVRRGEGTAYDIGVTGINGFRYGLGSGTWAVSGLPAGASSFFLGGFMSVSTAPNTPPGSYTLTITATLTDISGSPTRTHSTTATLVVTGR